MAANRLLKDWRGSDKVNGISVYAERFFIRLIMSADDYGCFYGDTRLLKANLFPLLIDSIREADLLRWLAECQKAGLIVLYESDNKKYLQIVNFGQRLRQKTIRFPLPLDSVEMLTHCGHDADIMPLEEKRREVEEKVNENADKPQHSQTEMDSFKNFQTWITENANTVSRMKEPFTISQYLKLKESFSSNQLKELILKMHNYQPLLTKSKSANLTFLNWSKKDFYKNNSEERRSFPPGSSPQEQKASSILNNVK